MLTSSCEPLLNVLKHLRAGTGLRLELDTVVAGEGLAVVEVIIENRIGDAG